jgi:arylsulfatase A-like enzyme
MRFIALFFCFSATTAFCAHAQEKPNVIIFFMDDMGYGDCRAYNPESKVSLPNIENLSAHGMRFTDAHSPSAVCAPSRYSVMTGNYPWRGRLENGTWMFHQRSQILDGQATLGQLMQTAGYSTAFFGKVHLGGTVFSTTTKKPVSWKYDYHDIDFSRKWKDGPSDLGFDFTYSLPQGIQGPPYIAFRNGFLDGNPDDLIEWKPGTYGDSVIPTNGFGLKQWDSSVAGPNLIREATGFIDRHVEADTCKPFFMHYCTESCHIPHTPPKTLAGKPVRGTAGDAHLDMLFEADIQLGMLVARLKAHGILENTLILFTSDNGGLARGKPGQKLLGHNSNAPLRGSKATIWEGGHRVPLIAHWGNGTRTGSTITPAATSSALVGLQDIFATLAELTGQTLQAKQGLDSQSFLPALLQQDPVHLRHELLVQANDGDGWGQKLAKAFREDQWKLIATKDRKPLHLFNLNEDVAEEHDLIDSGEQKSRITTMLRGLNRTLDSDRSTPTTRVTRKPVTRNDLASPDSSSSAELFTPVHSFAMKPGVMPDDVRINAVGTGKWQVQGKTPFTLHFIPKNAAAWDASSYRLLGLPICNKERGVVTLSARLNNSNPLGWGRHCVGSAVALRDEKTTIGFVFPTTEPHYDGPAVFQDQLGKPNGHRHHWRTFFPADVASMALEINSSSGKADIEISELFAAWEATPEREQALHTLPYLDRFGQVRAVEWPGKLHSLEQLKEELPLELATAAKVERNDISHYGGWKKGPRLEATGRFRTEKIDGRWWFVDPEGYLFFSAGACIAGTEAMTPVTPNRIKEHYFEHLPTKGSPYYWLTMPTRGKKNYVNFPALNAAESLGNRWQEISRNGIHDRMKMWGLNTLAAWSSTEIRQDKKTPYTLLASIWWLTGKKTPSPFRDDYVKDLCKALENSAWAKDDPYCLGIFIGNEFEWPDRFSQLVFELQDGDTTKDWVVRQIRQKYASLDQLNKAWDTSFSSWDQILQHGDTTHHASAAKDIDPLYFEFAREFFRKSKQAIEQSLPGTLFLGCRCHRGPNVLGRAAVGHADVFSVNVYDHEVRSWQVPDNADIPIIASEFHIGSSDRGVPSPGLSSVWNQRQRGLAYARYLASALANPKFVGVHWFQWIDQSAGGRRDRENHQVGLVDVTGRSHVPFVDIVSHVANKKDAVRYAQPASSIHALEKLLEDLPSKPKGTTTTSTRTLPATMVSRTPGAH